MSLNRLLLIAPFAATLLLYLAVRSSGESLPAFPRLSTSDTSVDEIIKNRTLGFRKILGLNLPERLDKHDTLSLLGRLTGVDISLLPGVRSSTERGMPRPHNGAAEKHIGAIRSHMNAYQKMLDEDWKSALILEDDTDWDINFVDSLRLFRQGLVHFIAQNSTIVPTPNDPWCSEAWDVLFLGWCLEGTPNDAYVYEDPYTPFVDRCLEATLQIFEYANLSLPTPDSPSGHRIIQKSRSPVCSWSYAISQRGAAKVLYSTTRQVSDPLDITLANMVEKNRLRAYTVVPPLTGVFSRRHKGDEGYTDSDIEAPRRRFDEGNDEFWSRPANMRTGVLESMHRLLWPEIEEQEGGYPG